MITRSQATNHDLACEPLEPRTLLDAAPWRDPLPNSTPASNKGVVVADFDLDGKIDVALAVGRELRFLKGNGDGTFAPPATLVLDADAGAIAVGQIDGDARPDLFSAAALRGGKLITRLVNFDPTLGRFKITARLVSQGAFDARRNPAFVDIAVQTGNLVGGWRDEAVVQTDSGPLRVIRAISRSSLVQVSALTTPYFVNLRSARLADLNSDGLDEIYTSDGSNLRGLRVTQTQSGYQETPVLYRAAEIGSFAIADMTGDGKLDFVLLQETGFTSQRRPLALLEGDGFGRIARLRDWEFATSATLDFSIIHALQDVNNDGRIDVVGQRYSVNQDRGGPFGSTSIIALLDDGAGGWAELRLGDFSFRSPPSFDVRVSLAALGGSAPDIIDLISYFSLSPAQFPASAFSVRPSTVGPVAPRLSGGNFRLNGFGTSATGFYANIATTTAHADLGGNIRRVEVIWDRNNNGLIDDGEETIGTADSSRASQNVLRVAALLPDDARSVPVFRLLARGVGIDGQLSNIIDLGSVNWSP
ncbi:MAG: VCBS repeat-containing protein [Phycisphaerales bacterium]|nr:VCBS repeat-containing protein [Phycisphaerales bacterium]